MPSPFPGMDPYLENHWGDVHTRLVLYACDELQPQLPNDLIARVEEYLAVEAGAEADSRRYYPDVKVSEERGNGTQTENVPKTVSGIAVAEPVVIALDAEPATLHEIQILDRGNRVITAIEVLSPANKIGEAGREAYRRKQHDFVKAGVNLVEIDLIREGSYMHYPPEIRLPADCRGPYRISTYRSSQPRRAEVYRVPLASPLPAVRIPLRAGDPDVILNLQSVLERSYENGRYGQSINYRIDPVPSLQGDDAVWADQLLKAKDKR